VSGRTIGHQAGPRRPAPDTERPPEDRRSSCSAVGPEKAPISSEPAMAREGADLRSGRAGVGVESGPDHRCHGQNHRTPAPRLMAIDARSASAVAKRARFAFTFVPSCGLHHRSGDRAVSLVRVEIPGFASPSHGGFALDRSQARVGHRL
jgi:hypothetical protein